ncbi:MAG: ribonuclease III [Oscillospiraceae bacterium]|jgi:ribonuclease-3|nr:ribonuclease III [Oscillospiraceae bacterium]
MSKSNILDLQDKLSYTFKNISYLKQALTHSSYANDSSTFGDKGNERLEFLGDSLLGMSIALLIYKNKPKLTEGQMTFLRSHIVCEKNLAELAKGFDLGAYLYLGRSEIFGKGRDRPALLADAFEAIIAAIYLDGGFEALEKVITHLFLSQINKPINKDIDYKSQLQEIIQAKGDNTIIYSVINTQGPAHNMLFTIKVEIDGKYFGEGQGSSKKRAEQLAAKMAVEKIKGV